MNWTCRFTARIGSTVALLLALFQFFAVAARAETAQTYVLGDQTIVLTHLSHDFGPPSIGVNDPGFRALLKAVGATMTWQPGERYVLITTAQPLVLSFVVGDTRYDVGSLSAQAHFAPYLQGSEVFLPFDELIRALDLAAKRDGNVNVLQPQIAGVDLQSSGAQVTLVARAGIPLHPRIVSESASQIVYEFDGFGSAVARERNVGSGGVRSVQVSTGGSVRQPKTTIAVTLQPGTHYEAPRSANGDFEVLFGGAAGGSIAAAPAFGSTPAPAAAQTETLSAPSENGSQAATVNAVDVAATSTGATITIAVTGNATYEWHRLRDPDNRFWIDIKGAQLQFPAREQSAAEPLASLRVRQNDPGTVRVAVSFTGPKSLSVSPSATGVTIAVGNDEIADQPRSGEGSVGSVVSVSEPQSLVTPVPSGDYAPAGDDNAWKFGPRSTYVPTNPKLIVIDPGHGGSDKGAIRNGLSEAEVNLDMAKRLRDILTARGWQVQMTRTTDVDVYAPNDSAHEELQARVDLANNAGARLLVSIHANSFVNSGPSGTTTYYSKAIDAPFAHIVERNLAASLGTKDDGTVKSHLYVTLHSFMPAVLVETAFLSNPDDFSRLNSPQWRQQVAESLANGIDQYTQAFPVNNSNGQ